jgi:hypothetical protein
MNAFYSLMNTTETISQRKNGMPWESAQFIVMPQADHGPQHQYPDLAAKYITTFIQSSLS